MRLVIDLEGETATFEYFFIHSSFWPGLRVPRYVCPFDEILDVHFMPGVNRHGWGPDALTIVTKRGTVTLTTDMSHFDEVRSVLGAVSELTPRGPIYENPWFLVVVGGAVAAVIIVLAMLMGWI